MEIILSIAAATLMLRVTFKTFFDDMDDFIECVKYWLTPDIIALIKGEWDREAWAELKLFLWLILGGFAGYATYRFLIS